MNDWTANVFLDPRSEEPVYLQIAHALMREVERGRFRPGDPLPGYRRLAEQLGVSRNTVMAAYAELQDEGWVVSTPGEGSAVALRLPRHVPARAAAHGDAAPVGFDLRSDPPPHPEQRGQLLDVASGMPDLRLLPGAALARAYRRALTKGAGRHPVEDAQGRAELRDALARMLSGTRAIAAGPERLLVTRGSQMALFLLAQALFAPGDAVAVEALGSREAWEAFARAGARCLPLPVDALGIRVDALEHVLAAGPLRAVFVTPQRQFPTLVALAAERRERLLELAASRRFAVLEMDQDFEFQFEGRPLAPLAARDAAGVVVHIGTLSKIFSPEVRLGFVHGPSPLIERMKELRAGFDRHGDPVLERAMAELMEEGEIQRHLNRMIKVYQRRRDALCDALRALPGAGISIDPPSGGLALWVRVAEAVDLDGWAARALKRGVSFRPGRHFAFDGAPVAGFRIGFSNYSEPELQEVARRLEAAFEDRG